MSAQGESIGDRLMTLAESRLSEFDMPPPLEAARDYEGVDPEGEPVFNWTKNPAYRGYAAWAMRMEFYNMIRSSRRQTPAKENAADGFEGLDPEWKDFFNRIRSLHRQTPTQENAANSNATHVIFSELEAPRALRAAVDFLALMESARLSFGLMLAFQGELGEANEALFCLFHYDTIVRLVSATDRLCTMFLDGLFSARLKRINKALKRRVCWGEYFCLKDDCHALSGKRLRGPVKDKAEFLRVAEQVRLYLQPPDNGKSQIISIRNRRHTLSHDIGTIPGMRLGKGDNVHVPCFISAYGSSTVESMPRKKLEEMVDISRDSYGHVLRFGALIFDLETMVAGGSV